MCLTLKDYIELTLSLIVAITTVVYATLTWLLVRESKSQRIALNEPRIYVGLQPNEKYMNIMELYVENFGNGVAYNIRFDFVRDFIFKNQKGKKLSEIAFFKKGLNTLSPKSKIKTYVTSLLEDSKEKFDNPIEINVTYDTMEKKDLKLNFILDFSEYEGLLYMKLDKTAGSVI